MGYERVKLGEVATIRGGKRLPAGRDFTTAETVHPYIRARDIGGGKVEIHDSVFLDEETARSLHRYTVSKGDVCLTIVGANVGEMGVVPPHLDGANLTENAVKIVTNGKADQSFLKYALLGDDALGQMKVLAGGAAQPKLGIYKIETIEFPLPPLPIQRRIASILSAYDELIENNQRRIKILESMARALYREWFVHFRFPGHESVPRVASPLGEIPQGWEVQRVPDCVQVNPRVTVPRDGEKPFVPMGCLSNDSMLISDVESRAGNSGAKFQNGDTLFARITPCLENGKTGFVQFLPDMDAVACGSTEFIVLRSRTVSPEFVYCLARSDEFRRVAIKSMSGATGRQRVQEQCFDDLQIAEPPRALLDQFSAIVAPSFQIIYKLHLQIQTLRRTRDLLLPRLLSGQIDVEAIDA